MQATVESYDPDSRTGTVVLDDGLRLRFDEPVFAGSGARMLRPGQRIFLEVDHSGSTPMITAMSLVRPTHPPSGTATP